jgi:ubiquinone/menaquinone biosynthesis C-methylase UbiE
MAMETRDALIEGYNQSAPSYDRIAGTIYLRALRTYLLPRLHVGPSPAVLDVGCGTGINLLEAARVLGTSERLHGIDLAPGMVEEARRKAAAAGVPAVFEVGDAEELPFDEASFDLVICNSVYHWFPDRPRAVDEMSRVVRPGGQVLLSSVVDPGYQEWVRLVDDVRSRLDVQRPWFPQLPTPAELMGDLRAAGLTLEYLVYEVEPFAVENPGAFVQIMTVVGPTWLNGIPPSGTLAAVTAVNEALSADADAPFVVTAAAVASVSRKPASD